MIEIASPAPYPSPIKGEGNGIITDATLGEI